MFIMSTFQKDIVAALMKVTLSICGVLLTWLYFEMKNDIERIDSKQELMIDNIHGVQRRQDVTAIEIQYLQKAVQKIEEK